MYRKMLCIHIFFLTTFKNKKNRGATQRSQFTCITKRYVYMFFFPQKIGKTKKNRGRRSEISSNEPQDAMYAYFFSPKKLKKQKIQGRRSEISSMHRKTLYMFFFPKKFKKKNRGATQRNQFQCTARR